MTIPEMLGQSAIMTVLGMGVVFSFLIILIIFMKLVEVLVKASGIDKEVATSASPAPASPAQGNAVVAAIAAAVSEKQKK